MRGWLPQDFCTPHWRYFRERDAVARRAVGSLGSRVPSSPSAPCVSARAKNGEQLFNRIGRAIRRACGVALGALGQMVSPNWSSRTVARAVACSTPVCVIADAFVSSTTLRPERVISWLVRAFLASVERRSGAREPPVAFDNGVLSSTFHSVGRMRGGRYACLARVYLCATPTLQGSMIS